MYFRSGIHVHCIYMIRTTTLLAANSHISHTGLDVKMEVTQCTGRVSANTRHHRHIVHCIYMYIVLYMYIVYTCPCIIMYIVYTYTCIYMYIVYTCTLYTCTLYIHVHERVASCLKRSSLHIRITEWSCSANLVSVGDRDDITLLSFEAVRNPRTPEGNMGSGVG